MLVETQTFSVRPYVHLIFASSFLPMHNLETTVIFSPIVKIFSCVENAQKVFSLILLYYDPACQVPTTCCC